MATTKTFNNVQIQLRYDTIANWTTNNPKLGAGEVALVTVPSADGDVKQAPAVLIKVGDGSKTFNELKFASGLAANVHDWALAADKPVYAATEITGLEDFINTEIQDTNTTYKLVKVDDYNYKLQYKELGSEEWADVSGSTVEIPKYDDTQVKADIAALSTKVGDTTVAEQISVAVEALKTGEIATAQAAADAAQAAADAAQGDVDALEATVGTVTTGKTVVQMIQEAQTAATYDDTEVRGLIKTNADDIDAVEAKVNTLVGEDANKSVRTIANEELAAQLIPENASEALDTLQEIAAWIQAHPDDASAMNEKISALETKVGTTDVDAQITAAIDALKAGDIAAAVNRIAALEADTHTHTNKTVLDGITAEKVSNWDAAKTGVDELNTKVGTVATGKTLVKMIQDAQTAATYDDTEVRDLIQTNATDIDTLETRATALETNAVLDGDTLILNCGTSAIA